MNQRLVSSNFPYVQILVTVQTSTGQLDVRLEALVDTGFDGDVVVPSSYLSGAGAPPFYERWVLADGMAILAGSYQAQVELIGISESYPVRVSLVGNEALVGRALTDRFRLTLDHGRELIIEP